MSMKKYKSVEQFFAEETLWKDEVLKLRDVVLSTGMDECLKWSIPNYVHNGQNIVGLRGFKSYFGLWFHQGALLSDPQQVLTNAQEGRTKAMRQWRMTSKSDIKVRAIKQYLKEAMTLAEQGRAIKPERNRSRIVVPAQLKTMLDRSPQAASQFSKLTPARRREYCEYIAEAKRDATKQRRLEKALPLIEAGVALSELYRR